MRTLILGLLLICAVQIRAQSWQQTNFSGSTLVLASNGKVLVACDTSGIDPIGTQYSTDLGNTWIQTDGPARLEQLIVHNGVFYGVDWLTSALSSSTDDGQSWNQLSESVNDIHVSGDVLISNNYSYLCISSDGTKWDTISNSTWPSDTSRGRGFTLGFSCAGDSMLAGLIAFPTFHHRKNRGFVSYNLGTTWIECSLPDSAARIDAVYGTNVLISVSGDAIFRSNDTGRSWNIVSEIHSFSIRKSGDYLYTFVSAANDSGAFSTDRGLTWHVSPGINDPDSTGRAAFTAMGSNLFMAVPDGHIHRLSIGSSDVPLDHGKNSVKVFPNPVRDILYLDHQSFDLSIRIVDVCGRVVLSMPNVQNSIDIRPLQAGVYTLLIGDQQMRFAKLP